MTINDDHNTTSTSSSGALPLRIHNSAIPSSSNDNAANNSAITISQQHQHQQHHDFHSNDSFLLNNDLYHDQNHHTEISPMLKMRRESAEDHTTSSSSTAPAVAPFHSSSSNQLPSETGWNGFNFNTPVTTAMQSSTTAFMQHRNQHNAPACLELNTSQSLGYPHHGTSSWPMSASSETFSPTGGIGQIPDFNNPFAMNQMNGGDFPGGPVLVSPGPLQHSTFPTSPPFSASSSDGHDGRHNSLQGRPSSPPFSITANVIRRDGIRKKNARFDIPAERNLKTIDQLIHATNDEQEIKELKQQKRLLRNRQAALDSRQRKKQHTERLEEEKKHYSAAITDLEEAMQDCKAREGEWIRKEESWAVAQQQYAAHFEHLRMQQEEMLRAHTIETGELRRKNAMLLDQLNRMEPIAMSNAPSSHGMSAEYGDFDQMNLGTWNDMSMAHEFTVENNHGTPQEHSSKITEAEKPAASALLLMLLLCGAWVASRNNASGSNVLPAIPDEMRAASAVVLDNLYRDSGVQLDGLNSASKAAANTASKTVMSAFESAGAFSSNLDALHHRLTTPTNQQLKDQAFSLTPSQYYEMTSGDARYQQAYYDHHQQQQRSRMIGGPVQQDASVLSTADTYTRSLLRDKVSTKILQDFARMVAQSNNKNSHTWKTESM